MVSKLEASPCTLVVVILMYACYCFLTLSLDVFFALKIYKSGSGCFRACVPNEF